MRRAWDKNFHVSPGLLDDYGMIQTLVLFLIAKKKDHFMSDWLFVDVPEVSFDLLGKTAFTWRAVLWRNLVDAELILADPSEKCYDAAIKSLFAIFN